MPGSNPRPRFRTRFFSSSEDIRSAQTTRLLAKGGKWTPGHAICQKGRDKISRDVGVIPRGRGVGRFARPYASRKFA